MLPSQRQLTPCWLVRHHKLPDTQPHWAQKQHNWVWETLISPPAVANTRCFRETKHPVWVNTPEFAVIRWTKTTAKSSFYMTLLKIRSKNSPCLEIYFSNIRFGKSSFLVEEILEKSFPTVLFTDILVKTRILFISLSDDLQQWIPPAFSFKLQIYVPCSINYSVYFYHTFSTTFFFPF